jgi:hypothetical protein
MPSTLPIKVRNADGKAGSIVAMTIVAATLLTGCVSKTLEVTSAEDLARLERVLAREEDDRSHAVTLAHARELISTPLRFSGRVVRPDGTGIPDARVEIAVFDRVVEPFHFPYFGYTALSPLQTDAEGYFDLPASRGMGLHVQVSKPGFRPVDLSHRTYQIEHVLPVAEDFGIPGEDEIALFTMKPRTAEDQLRKVATGAIRIPDSGSVDISLTGVHPHGVPAGSGHLALRCERGDTRQPRYDWSCRASATGGGIQLRRILDFDLAPESGYEPAILLGYASDEPEWRDRLDETVFVRLASGNYGYLLLKVRTRGDFFVAIEGVLNEHGSRLMD